MPHLWRCQGEGWGQQYASIVPASVSLRNLRGIRASLGLHLLLPHHGDLPFLPTSCLQYAISALEEGLWLNLPSRPQFLHSGCSVKCMQRDLGFGRVGGHSVSCYLKPRASSPSLLATGDMLVSHHSHSNQPQANGTGLKALGTSSAPAHGHISLPYGVRREGHFLSRTPAASQPSISLPSLLCACDKTSKAAMQPPRSLSDILHAAQLIFVL